MRHAPLALSLLAIACTGLQQDRPTPIQGSNRPDAHIALKPFSAALAFDPPSFQLHGNCGRGMTTQPVRQTQVVVTANSGNWILWPGGGRAQFEMTNTINNHFGVIGGGPLLPATFTWAPVATGNYLFRATIAATDSHPEYFVGPDLYVIPLEVTLKVQAGSTPGSIKATASASTNSGAPTTFQYSFCVRSADGSANDAWSNGLSASTTWETPLPGTGPWLVYVAAFATQSGYPQPANDFAGIGEHMARFP